MGSVEAAAQEEVVDQSAPPAAGSGLQLARAVKGIISYTHWPVEPAVVQLCIIGDGRYEEQLLAALPQVAGRQVRARRVSGAGLPLHACNALYLGADTGAEKLILNMPRQAVLTISEQDFVCRGGSMFCLNIRPDRVSFSLNVDAVARSGLRVDPKVLILGRAGGRQP